MTPRPLYPATHAAERPNAAAVVLAPTGEVITWRELDQRSNRIAHLFRQRGMGRGDHVTLVMDNHPTTFEVMWAVLRSGLTYTCVNTYLTPAEAAEVVAACDTGLIVTTTANGGLTAALVDGLAEPVDVLVVPSRTGGDTTGGRWPMLADVVSDLPTSPIADEAEGAPRWFSSGTSGRPKGVVRPLPDAPVGLGDPVAQHYAQQFGLGSDTVHLCVGPLHHAAPIGFSTSVHRVGGTVVLTERFDPGEILTWIERYRVTFTHLVPTMFSRLLRLPADVRARADVSSLERVIHGAAPCPVHVKAAMIEWLGPIVDEYYGGTEGVGSTVIRADEWLAHPGSVGRASRGIIHVTDDDGAELPVGETGLVWFENPTAKAEYHGDEAETAAITHPAGWQTMGDIGHVDADGYLFLTDRWSHKIVTGGVNVFPREIEDTLTQHPHVLDAAVIGIPDDDLGEVVCAVVELVDEADAPDIEAELVSWCRERLSRQKVPRRVDVVDALPRADNGKLYKRVLRDRYWEGRATKIT